MYIIIIQILNNIIIVVIPHTGTHPVGIVVLVHNIIHRTGNRKSDSRRQLDGDNYCTYCVWPARTGDRWSKRIRALTLEFGRRLRSTGHSTPAPKNRFRPRPRSDASFPPFRRDYGQHNYYTINKTISYFCYKSIHFNTSIDVRTAVDCSFSSGTRSMTIDFARRWVLTDNNMDHEDLRHQRLPQSFSVRELGSTEARGLWGIKHTRKPVDLMVAAAKSSPTPLSPQVELRITEEGCEILGNKFSKMYPIHTVSYGVQVSSDVRARSFCSTWE